MRVLVETRLYEVPGSGGSCVLCLHGITVSGHKVYDDELINVPLFYYLVFTIMSVSLSRHHCIKPHPSTFFLYHLFL